MRPKPLRVLEAALGSLDADVGSGNSAQMSRRFGGAEGGQGRVQAVPSGRGWESGVPGRPLLGREPRPCSGCAPAAMGTGLGVAAASRRRQAVHKVAFPCCSVTASRLSLCTWALERMNPGARGWGGTEGMGLTDTWSRKWSCFQGVAPRLQCPWAGPSRQGGGPQWHIRVVISFCWEEAGHWIR